MKCILVKSLKWCTQRVELWCAAAAMSSQHLNIFSVRDKPWKQCTGDAAGMFKPQKNAHSQNGNHWKHNKVMLAKASPLKMLHTS